MTSPDIEIGNLLSTTNPNLGFFSALDVIIRSRPDPDSFGSFQDAPKRELELVIQEDQDDLTGMLAQNPQNAEILFDALLVDNIALGKVRGE